MHINPHVSSGDGSISQVAAMPAALGHSLHTWNGVVAVFLPKPAVGPSSAIKSKQSPGSWLCQRSGTSTLQASYESCAQTFVLTLAVRGAVDGIASAPVLAQMQLDLFKCSCAVKVILNQHEGQPGEAPSSTAVLLLGACSKASTGTANLPSQQQKQVVAFRFSSMLDAYTLKALLTKAAQEPAPGPATLPAQLPVVDAALATAPRLYTQGILPASATPHMPALQQRSQQQLPQQTVPLKQPELHPAAAACVSTPDTQQGVYIQGNAALTGPTAAAAQAVQSGEAATTCGVATAAHTLLADLTEEEQQLRRLLEDYVAEPGFMEFVDKLEKVWTRVEAAAVQQADELNMAA